MAFFYQKHGKNAIFETKKIFFYSQKKFFLSRTLLNLFSSLILSEANDEKKCIF